MSSSSSSWAAQHPPTSPPRSASSATASGRRGTTQAFFGPSHHQATWGGSSAGLAMSGSLSASAMGPGASPLQYNSPTKRFGYTRWPPLISPTPPDPSPHYSHHHHHSSSSYPTDTHDDGYADVRLEVERTGHNLTSVMMDPRAPGGVSAELEVRACVHASLLSIVPINACHQCLSASLCINTIPAYPDPTRPPNTQPRPPTQAALLEQPLPPTPVPSPATGGGLSSSLSGSGSSSLSGAGAHDMDDVRGMVHRAGPLLQRYRQNHHAPPEARGYRPEVFAARKATDGVCVVLVFCFVLRACVCVCFGKGGEGHCMCVCVSCDVTWPHTHFLSRHFDIDTTHH
jgi:hypothetical protein